MPMTATLKNKLIQLGVPASRHDAASLAGLFPAEFKMSGASLSAAEIAGVYVMFVEHGLIVPPRSSRAPLQAHVCHFYHDDEESLTTTAAFLEEGLRSGECCLWVAPPWMPVSMLRAAFRRLRPELEEAETAGRISFFVDTDVHLDESYKMRDAQGIIRFWIQHEQEALALGFRGLRIAGDGTPLLAANGWMAGVEYERDCDKAFTGRRITALCSYSVAEVSSERLASVLSGHALGVARTAGGWKGLHPGVGVTTALEMLKAR